MIIGRLPFTATYLAPIIGSVTSFMKTMIRLLVFALGFACFGYEHYVISMNICDMAANRHTPRETFS